MYLSEGQSLLTCIQLAHIIYMVTYHNRKRKGKDFLQNSDEYLPEEMLSSQSAQAIPSQSLLDYAPIRHRSESGLQSQSESESWGRQIGKSNFNRRKRGRGRGRGSRRGRGKGRLKNESSGSSINERQYDQQIQINFQSKEKQCKDISHPPLQKQQEIKDIQQQPIIMQNPEMQPQQQEIQHPIQTNPASIEEAVHPSIPAPEIISPVPPMQPENGVNSAKTRSKAKLKQDKVKRKESQGHLPKPKPIPQQSKQAKRTHKKQTTIQHNERSILVNTIHTKPEKWVTSYPAQSDREFSDDADINEESINERYEDQQIKMLRKIVEEAGSQGISSEDIINLFKYAKESHQIM